MSEPEIQHPITANVWGVILRFGHVASVGMNLDHARKTAKEVGGYVMRGTVTFEEQIPSNDIVHKIEQGLKEKRSPREIADWIVYHLDVYGQWYAKHPDEPAPGRAVPPQS